MLYRALPRTVVVLTLALLLRDPAMAEEAPQEPLERATIRVDLPENARLTIDGESTVSTGTQRVFVSPPLKRGKDFSYTLRSELKWEDKTISMSKKITVRAGEETRVDLRSGYVTAAGAGRGIEEAAEDRTDKPGAIPPGKPLRFDLDRFFKDYDKNKDGHLTRDELPPELRPAFDRLDTDKNGKISREELERGIVHLQPARRPSDLIHVLIEMSDCDDVCHGEVQRAYDILRKLDKNKDGKIDPDELKAAREQIIKDRVDYLFKELDKNKDGKISRDEAQGMLRQNFDEIDRNKDGFIDREELTRAATERLEPAASGGSRQRPKAEPPRDK
jgi:uncharacterized protein (TIGR03000 family)